MDRRVLLNFLRTPRGLRAKIVVQLRGRSENWAVLIVRSESDGIAIAAEAAHYHGIPGIYIE